MDRLSHPWTDREQRLAAELAEAELRLDRHRQVRDSIVAGAVLASVLCWISARFAVAILAILLRERFRQQG